MLIREALTNRFKLKTGRKKFKIGTVNGDSINTKEVALKIFDTNGNNELYIPKAFTIPRKMFNIPSQNPLAQNEMYEEFLHLMNIQVPLTCSSEVKVLKGTNSPDAFQQLELRKGTQDQSYTIKETLGFVLFGNQITNSNQVKNSRVNQGNTQCINTIRKGRHYP